MSILSFKHVDGELVERMLRFKYPRLKSFSSDSWDEIKKESEREIWDVEMDAGKKKQIERMNRLLRSNAPLARKSSYSFHRLEDI